MSEESGPRAASPASSGGLVGRPWYIGGLLIGSALVLGGLQQDNKSAFVETRAPIAAASDTTPVAPSTAAVPAATNAEQLPAEEHKPWFTGSRAHGDIFESALDSPEVRAANVSRFANNPYEDYQEVSDDLDSDIGNLGEIGETTEALFSAPLNPASDNESPLELSGSDPADEEPYSEAVDVPSTYQLVIQPGDTLDQRFTRLGVASAELAALINTPHAKELLNRLHSGEVLLLTVNPDASVDRVEYRARDGRTLTINRSGDRFESQLQEPTIAPEEFKLAKGEIQNSFYVAAREAGLSNSLRSQFAKMLGSQINFGRQIQPGDRFKVLYRQQSDNRGNSKDRIVAGELTNRGKTYRAVRYTTKDGRSGYFLPNGESVDGGFLRYPLAYKRVSSGFSKRRWHPKLNRIRAHLGVDFAAAMGTPVKAPAAGKVIFAGVKRGYGNVLEVDHGGGITTVYAHLSRFARSIRKGSRISQGAVIAYVGKSGLATGPHLHYEFHKNGKPVDPLKVRLPNGPVLAAQESKEFKAFVKDALTQLDGKADPITIAAAAADQSGDTNL